MLCDLILYKGFGASKLLRVEPARDSQERGVAGDISRGHPAERWGRAATVYAVPWSLDLGEFLEELAIPTMWHGYTPGCGRITITPFFLRSSFTRFGK